MKLNNLFILVLLAATLFSCGNKDENKEVQQTEENTTVEQNSTEVTVDMNAKSGSNVDGTVKFKTMGVDGVMMTVALTGLEPGEHAIHIHETGDCSAADATSAGGHWNPTSENHGKWGDDAHHLGDIANLVANENGTANLSFTTDLWTLTPGEENSINGKAVVVHAKADDFTSQPSGAAGARVACGVIQ